jgi:glyoxylase-like metal-dependent hydrolase (beta-lactamase superfamily II)
MLNKNLSRRAMLNSLGLGTAALGLGPLITSPALQAASSKTSPGGRNPWIYAFKIGNLEAWSISDGFMKFGAGLDLMYPENERPAMKRMLEDNYEPTDFLPLYINILVIRSDNEVIIFDAGFGIVERKEWGWLTEGLETIGIKRSEVTAAFLSHAHGDHMNGLVAPDESFMFPNAAIHTTPEEYSFWRQTNHDFSKSKRNPKAIPRMIKKAQKNFEILRPNIQTTKVGSALFGGLVTVEDGFGHTPGHAIYRIASAGETLLHIVDLAHSHLFMFHDPAWSIGLDHTPALAIKTRRRVFARAARDKTRCYGFHVPWPGIGGIAQKGNKESYAWIPERNWW